MSYKGCGMPGVCEELGWNWVSWGGEAVGKASFLALEEGIFDS